MPKSTTRRGVHFRHLATEQHGSQKNHSGGEPLATVSDLIGPRIEPQNFRAASAVINHYSLYLPANL